MVDKVPSKKSRNVGGQLFEELFFEFIEKKYAISKEDLLKILEDKRKQEESFPAYILRVEKLSSLEAIVKFLRENKNLSYAAIGILLSRNPKTLAVTYSIALRKMSEPFESPFGSKEKQSEEKQIPFVIFSSKLSVLECICTYLKSEDYTYAKIARLLGKNQRTIWTVCKRADNKSKKVSTEKLSKNHSFKVKEKSKDDRRTG